MSNFKFSIITAVYNVEEYVKDTIESIVNQTIGFEENIQLILIDDGSSDSSGLICDQYKDSYPNNVIVVHKENGGVSSARNEGLKYAEGEYVNFVDSDDKLGLNVLEEVYDFFKKNDDCIDVVSIPIQYFEAKHGNHMLNYKFFPGSRVVDLEDDWFCPQMHVASSFIRRDILEDLFFDSNLAYAEDAKFVLQAIMKKKKIGLLSSCRYWYRSRKTGLSAIQNSGKKKNWYLPVVKHFHSSIIDYSIKMYGAVPKFVQMVLMYDLQWRFKINGSFIYEAGLSEEEVEEYIGTIKNIIQYIDDDVIYEQRNLLREHKNYIFKFKYGVTPKLEKEENNIIFSYSSNAVFSLSNCKVQFEFLKIENSTLYLEGFVSLYNISYDSVVLKIFANKEEIPFETTTRSTNSECFGEKTLMCVGFKTKIPLDKNIEVTNIRVGALINGMEIVFRKSGYKYFMPLSNKCRNYYKSEKWIVKGEIDRATIIVSRSSILKRLYSEAKLLRYIKKVNTPLVKNTFKLRWKYYFRKLFKRKPVWLISDRYTNAGDNGEALFRFLCKEHPEIDARFVLSKNSADFSRMEEIGPVLEYNSKKHRLFVLLSEFIFSSQGEPEYYDLFDVNKGEREVVRDITANKKFVFLQHGVIYNDLSGWLNRYNKNFYGFVTTANGEYDSILNGAYNYSAEKVWLTGLPRFDRLYDNAQKTISIMPTWRKYLTAGCNRKTYEWKLVNNFDESKYYTFYNSLLNNERLLKSASEYGYKINFVLHPIFRSASDLFVGNEIVNIVKEGFSYTDIYAVSDLVMTDYSSAVFDFAYMRKPLIYTYFDKDEFYGNNHTVKKGYFDIERDGFGEVTYDLETTVDCLIEYMKNGCELKPMYRERIDKFFAFDDKNNCQRIYDKIMSKK